MREKYINTRHSGMVEVPTPKGDAQINAGIAADPDTYEMTAEQIARLKPAKNLDNKPVTLDLSDKQLAQWEKNIEASSLPRQEVERLKKQVGRPKEDNPKEPISIRLSPEVTEYFRSTGKGWHSRINKILLDHVRQG